MNELTRSPAVAVLIAVVAGYVGGWLLLRLLRPLLHRIAVRSTWQWDDALVTAVGTPVSLLVAVQAIQIALPWLDLDARAYALVETSAAIATTALVLWTAFRAIDVVVAMLAHRSWALERPASRSVLAIVGRIAKVVVIVLALIVILAYLGVSVASLIAGLGIGGLAVALAAQKTVENLFGTLSLGVDQPLREGDFVKVDDVLGTVEAIGLRSTRIRTLDRTIVTIPNGALADLRIESFAARDRIRLATILGLVYETSAGQMREVLAGLERVLRSHPKIWTENVIVRFQKFGESSLDIEVMAWFETSDWGEFQAIRQEILLGFMDVIETAGTSLAFPTRTLHVTNGQPPGTSTRSASRSTVTSNA